TRPRQLFAATPRARDGRVRVDLPAPGHRETMTLLVYGANGYTGTLVAERSAERGLPLVVAGRRGDEMVALGRRLNVEHRVFSLDAPADVDRGMAGVNVVLNCAGPFVRT